MVDRMIKSNFIAKTNNKVDRSTEIEDSDMYVKSSYLLKSPSLKMILKKVKNNGIHHKTSSSLPALPLVPPRP